MTRMVSIADAKSGLSELVNQVAFGHERVVIARRGKPLVALVTLEELDELDHMRKPDTPVNLAAIAGQWPDFEEIEPHIEQAFTARGRASSRPVSLD